MPKEKLMLGLISETPTGYLLELLNPWMKFEGVSREDCIDQAKAAYLKLYAENADERQRVAKEMIDFTVDLPDG